MKYPDWQKHEYYPHITEVRDCFSEGKINLGWNHVWEKWMYVCETTLCGQPKIEIYIFEKNPYEALQHLTETLGAAMTKHYSSLEDPHSG